jgi:hypothetical protein
MVQYLEKFADKGYALFPRAPNNKLNLELLTSTSLQIRRKLATFISLSVAEYLSTATDWQVLFIVMEMVQNLPQKSASLLLPANNIKPSLEIVEEHIAVNPPQIGKLYLCLPICYRTKPVPVPNFLRSCPEPIAGGQILFLTASLFLPGNC